MKKFYLTPYFILFSFSTAVSFGVGQVLMWFIEQKAANDIDEYLVAAIGVSLCAALGSLLCRNPKPNKNLFTYVPKIVLFIAAQVFMVFYQQKYSNYFGEQLIIIVILIMCITFGVMVCAAPKPNKDIHAYAPMFITLSCILIYYAFMGNPQINSSKYLLFAIYRTFITILGPIVFIYLFYRENKTYNFEKTGRFWILLVALISSASLYCTVSFIRYETVFTDGRYTNDGIYFGEYAPFARNNNLVKPDFVPSLTISKNHPRLDGATAFFPVYSAIAETVYKNMGAGKVDKYVLFSKTDTAYDNLITGKSDVIFTFEPSKQQEEKAKQAGVELIMTPIGKEAFIFFTNNDNDIITDITEEQIVKIYTNEIKNWAELGGEDAEINALTRPDNSGSQTIMDNKVMKGKRIVGATVYSTMYDILEAAISYDKGGVWVNSIGYSFRFFAKHMSGGDRYKIMSINGVEPTRENIQNGSYPYIVEFYAITTKENLEKSNVREMIQWITSEQGQELIELTGYNSVD